MKNYILITTNPLGDGKAFGQAVSSTVMTEIGKLSIALIAVLTIVLIAKSFKSS
jgi:hypothetical protein